MNTTNGEVRCIIQEIEQVAKHAVGVNEFEDLLQLLLAALQSEEVDRRVSVEHLLRLIDDWPFGAVEILEFTMHKLKWPEIRTALEFHVEHGDDFRTRNLAVQVLQAYADDWQDGDIYRAYRKES